MATTHRSDLVEQLEKALTDEAYDGGMGALSPDEFAHLVRTLAVTVEEVVREHVESVLAHVPSRLQVSPDEEGDASSEDDCLHDLDDEVVPRPTGVRILGHGFSLGSGSRSEPFAAYPAAHVQEVEDV